MLFVDSEQKPKGGQQGESPGSLSRSTEVRRHKKKKDVDTAGVMSLLKHNSFSLHVNDLYRLQS